MRGGDVPASIAAVTTLLIDMPSGVAGDMLLAALLACGGDRARLEADLLALGCGPIRIAATAVTVGSLSALQVDVDAEQEPVWHPTGPVDLSLARPATVQPAGQGAIHAGSGHGHRPYRLIRDLIARSGLPARVLDRAQRVFRLLAESEAAVHGCDPETVEFHEVGSLDAIADVVGCCLLLEQLGVERILAGPIVPGHGTVRCAHGRMPVPVPAVAEMLRRTGAPTVILDATTGELTTPTGGALVCALSDAFLGQGAGSGRMQVRATGYGAGHRQIPGLVNAVRCTVLVPAGTAAAGEDAVEISATLDDATGEDLAIVVEDLLEAGALDAWMAPVVMKKGRPGVVLSLLCRPGDRDRLAGLMLMRTPTLGVRYRAWERLVLPRSQATVIMEGRNVRIKVAGLPDGSRRAKPEADDVAALARALGVGPSEARRRALAAWAASAEGRRDG